MNGQCTLTFLAQNCSKRVCSETALFHVSQNRFNQKFKTELVFNIQPSDLIHKHCHIITLRCCTQQKRYNLENKMLIEIKKKQGKIESNQCWLMFFCSSHMQWSHIQGSVAVTAHK